MEKRLFYLYMKYIKESCPSIWKRLGKISVKLKAYLWLMVIFYIGSIISLMLLKYLPDSWSISVSILSILSILACIICGILLYIATEKYEIAVSSQTMNEYWNYCFGLRDWFRENFSNRSKNDINNDLQDVKSRLDLYLKQQAEIIDKRNNRVDKWTQALAIPFVLAIITSILEKSSETISAISEIFTILLIIAVVFGVVWVINSIVKLFKKQKLEQMKYFSYDLQGALDCVNYSGIEKCTESIISK